LMARTVTRKELMEMHRAAAAQSSLTDPALRAATCAVGVHRFFGWRLDDR